MTIHGEVGCRLYVEAAMSGSDDIRPTTGRCGCARVCTRRLMSYSRNSS